MGSASRSIAGCVHAARRSFRQRHELLVLDCAGDEQRLDPPLAEGGEDVALAEGYRFLSFGDAMLLTRTPS